MDGTTHGADPACRVCGAGLQEQVADLGLVPLSLASVPPAAAGRPLACAPLRALVCTDCRLVQTPGAEVAAPLPPLGPQHGFAGLIATRLRLGPGTPVAAFDPACLGPFRDRAIPARAVPAGARTALALREAMPPPVLLLAGPVLATASDPADALAGVRALLAPGGVAVFDLPDLLGWLRGNRFDRLGHALRLLPSVLVAEMMLGLHDLVPFALETLPAPGGWLRLLVRHAEDATKPIGGSVLTRRAEERAAGLEGSAAYARAAVQVAEARLAVLDLLVAARREGRRVAGFGAGPTAATLAAACGLGPGLLAGTVDPSGAAAGLLLPGSAVPVWPAAALAVAQPDLLLVLDGTPAAEVRAALAGQPGAPGRIAEPLPGLRID